MISRKADGRETSTIKITKIISKIVERPRYCDETVILKIFLNKHINVHYNYAEGIYLFDTPSNGTVLFNAGRVMRQVEHGRVVIPVSNNGQGHLKVVPRSRPRILG